MSVKYRYHRPIEYNARRIGETRPSLYGGICFRFEERERDQIVTFSVCHPTELFSKSVAKRIADERAASEHRWLLERSAPDYAIEALFNIAKFTTKPTDDPFQLYRLNELDTLRERYFEINRQNYAVHHLMTLGQEAIESMRIAKSYETMAKVSKVKM